LAIVFSIVSLNPLRQSQIARIHRIVRVVMKKGILLRPALILTA
jgi:hypothetical protein